MCTVLLNTEELEQCFTILAKFANFAELAENNRHAIIIKIQIMRAYFDQLCKVCQVRTLA